MTVDALGIFNQNVSVVKSLNHGSHERATSLLSVPGKARIYFHDTRCGHGSMYFPLCFRSL